MGMSKSNYYCAFKESGLERLKPTAIQELSENDFNKKMQFCETMLPKFEENPKLVKNIIWSDESQVTLNSVISRHNCCHWAYSDQHKQISVSNSKEGIMVWCGIT